MKEESAEKERRRAHHGEVLNDGRTWEEVCMGLYDRKPKQKPSTETRDKLYKFFYEEDSPYHTWFLPEDFIDRK